MTSVLIIGFRVKFKWKRLEDKIFHLSIRLFGQDIEKYLQHVYANEWASQSVSHYNSLYKKVALIKTANVGLTGTVI